MRSLEGRVSSDGQFTIFSLEQTGFSQERQSPVVTITHRPPFVDVTWTTYLSAMRVKKRATEQLGILHGVSVDYGQPETAPTATYTTSFDPRHFPVTSLSRLIAATSANLGLDPDQIKRHLTDFINPPVFPNPEGWLNRFLNRPPQSH